MTTLTDDDASRADLAVARAMAAFETTIQALEAAVAELRDEACLDPRTVMGDLKVMNTAFAHALQMEAKARENGEKFAGRAGTGALDLDAARAEIGLRLACLRSAGDD